MKFDDLPGLLCRNLERRSAVAANGGRSQSACSCTSAGGSTALQDRNRRKGRWLSGGGVRIRRLFGRQVVAVVLMIITTTFPVLILVVAVV